MNEDIVEIVAFIWCWTSVWVWYTATSLLLIDVTKVSWIFNDQWSQMYCYKALSDSAILLLQSQKLASFKMLNLLPLSSLPSSSDSSSDTLGFQNKIKGGEATQHRNMQTTNRNNEQINQNTGWTEAHENNI